MNFEYDDSHTDSITSSPPRGRRRINTSSAVTAKVIEANAYVSIILSRFVEQSTNNSITHFIHLLGASLNRSITGF